MSEGKVCILISLALAALTAVGALTLQPNPQPQGVSIGAAVTATCADITTGAVQVATFGEWVRFATIQNLSAEDLEIEIGAATTSRATCNCVVPAGETVELTAQLRTIAIKNIGSGTADLNGSDRTVIISGWR